MKCKGVELKLKNRSISAGVGLISGIILIIWSIQSTGSLGMFWDMPSIIITLGGSFCAILTCLSQNSPTSK